ncbi:hypothetical protein phytr_10590 [Candidatus Phycorickettsia trachydisci]|uniref:ProQ/FinO domain-containing protein n=1 Tax=Candidatus Phycorickettsia trachydisci TaxID=2115978 RepID=A0A2P1P9P2_9RICK|nr:ProQ/FINO family protein [Candidatus Phycorickettsia trachydisci]AVP87987.1 hypothetical protein phytr_10590 [Candidatus Phycorickettsia trachydisci]
MPLKLKLKESSSVEQELKKLQDKLQNATRATERESETSKTFDSSSSRPDFKNMLKKLNKRYPKLFPLKGPRPALKKGIKNDLASFFEDISKTKIYKFLYWYTFSKAYCETHIAGTPRYNLDYKVVGYITEEESKGLRDEVEKMNTTKKSSSI